MKYVIVIASLFLVRPLLAQEKGSNVIIIKMDTTGAFKRLTNLLYDKGYGVEQSDPANGAIFSSEKAVGITNVKIRMRLKDSAVYITGTVALASDIHFGSVTLPKTYDPIYCAGSKGSPLRKAWNELNSFALAVGDRIEYVKN